MLNSNFKLADKCYALSMIVMILPCSKNRLPVIILPTSIGKSYEKIIRKKRSVRDIQYGSVGVR